VGITQNINQICELSKSHSSENRSHIVPKYEFV